MKFDAFDKTEQEKIAAEVKEKWAIPLPIRNFSSIKGQLHP